MKEIMNKYISTGLLMTRKLLMKHLFDVYSHFKVVKNIA